MITFLIGVKLNNLCIQVNFGLMPVIPIFNRHMEMSGIHAQSTYQNCNLWYLSDIIDVYWNVYSIGDLLIFLMPFLIIMSYLNKITKENKGE